MNERPTADALGTVARFEQVPTVSVEDMQPELQVIEPLLEGSTARPERDLIDLAADSPELVVHTRSADEHRSAAVERLRQLRRVLVACRDASASPARTTP